jgi:hypothetical protein
MTVPGDEQVQTGPGDFRDVVDVQLLDESLQVAARIARTPSAGRASVTVLVLVDGQPVLEMAEDVGAGVDTWEHAVAGPLQLTIEQPLERWRLLLDAPGARIELELRAQTAPAGLSEPATSAAGRAGGLHRYAQLCVATGTAEVGGRRRAVEAPAVRAHRWGPVGEVSRARFLTVASEQGELLTVAAVQAPGAQAHGEELVGAHTTRAGDGGGDGPLPFETVRVSTVFGDDGLPVKAGAELFRPGDELPSRLAGIAAGGIAAALPGTRASLTLFRFTLDGVPAFGSYEIEAAA